MYGAAYIYKCYYMKHTWIIKESEDNKRLMNECGDYEDNHYDTRKIPDPDDREQRLSGERK